VLFFRLQYELDSLMEESMEIKPGIPEFFRGRSIFITGATGFMGKVLLEKLLRSCPDLGTLYLLMRAKRGQQPEQRLNDLSQSKVKYECSVSVSRSLCFYHATLIILKYLCALHHIYPG
jgi:FlaA1/EpsC-like NDP-sugar epimerase